MVDDLRYFNSLELEVESLKSQLETQKTQFLNEIGRLSREYYYADHMNAILGVYTKLDEVANLQCDYLKEVDKFTTQILPQNVKIVSKNTNVIAPGMYKLDTRKTQTRTTQLPQDIKKTNKRVSFSTRVIATTSVRRPQLKSNQLEDRVLPNNSEVKIKEVEEQRRNFKFSKNKTSVSACNDSLNVKTLHVKTSKVNFVCVTLGKCVLNDNHDLYVLHYINCMNNKKKQPIAIPISANEPKQIVNQSVATSHQETIASESTKKNPRKSFRKLHEHVSKTSNWWYSKISPPGYQWKPKSSALNVKPNLIEIVLFIVDFGCSKHMTGNLKLLSNFVEKFLGTVKFGNDQIAPILRYGDLKSTCYIHDLKGNDLLTGSRGTNLYSITLQDTSSPNPICLMAKASLLQAWLCHRRLSYINFDTINLLSKNDIVTGLPKLKFVKDHLCSSFELGKAKHETPQVLIDFLKLVQRGLHAQVRIVRTDKGTKFLNKTLHEYFAKEDDENLDKMKGKGSACIFVGSDPIPQCLTMALEKDSLSPVPQSQENVPQTDAIVTTSNELDLLFSLMFDDLLNASTPVMSKSFVVTAADARTKRQQHNTTPSTSTTVAADLPPLNIPTTPKTISQAPIQAPTVTPTKNLNQAETQTEENVENAQVEEVDFVNIFSTSVHEQGETSSRYVDSSNMHTFYQPHPS
ncbi:retrovirus-related pol polyprotein from transposon TNT 1-94 [Tanacetum coccineum]